MHLRIYPAITWCLSVRAELGPFYPAQSAAAASTVHGDKTTAAASGTESRPGADACGPLMRTSCAITDRGGEILRSEIPMYVNDGLMVASARNHCCRSDYTAIGIYWLQVWCRIRDRDGGVYDTTFSSGCGGCERSGWMEGVDGCGCCAVAGVVHHLQPIVLRAVSNERAPLTRAERPERDRVIKAARRTSHLLPSPASR